MSLNARITSGYHPTICLLLTLCPVLTSAAGQTLPAFPGAGGGRMINSQQDVGGWPDYAAGTPPADADSDGMPDDREGNLIRRIPPARHSTATATSI